MNEIKRRSRFSNPTLLTDDTLVLGIPMKQWDQLFTRGLDAKLKEIKSEIARVKHLNKSKENSL